MATSKKMLEQEPSEIEMLLPWHAAGTLNPRDARRVEEALARDPELARQYAAIREEYAETIDLNESLGAPSARAMRKLFAAIDAEPASKPSLSRGIWTRIAGFFASLSPRTLAWSSSLGALALVLQAGVIGTLVKNQPDLVPDRVIEHGRARHPIVGSGTAAARAGAVRAGRAHRRHHRTARPLSGRDHRYAGRNVSPAIWQQGDGEGSNCRSDEQAAKREDYRSRGGCAVSRAAHRAGNA